jgi:hypothetical protein
MHRGFFAYRRQSIRNEGQKEGEVLDSRDQPLLLIVKRVLSQVREIRNLAAIENMLIGSVENETNETQFIHPMAAPQAVQVYPSWPLRLYFPKTP